MSSTVQNGENIGRFIVESHPNLSRILFQVNHAPKILPTFDLQLSEVFNVLPAATNALVALFCRRFSQHL